MWAMKSRCARSWERRWFSKLRADDSLRRTRLELMHLSDGVFENDKAGLKSGLLAMGALLSRWPWVAR